MSVVRQNERFAGLLCSLHLGSSVLTTVKYLLELEHDSSGFMSLSSSAP